MSLFVLSQVLVGIAICSDVASFQFKERSHIISCLLVSCIMISLHFMLLNHWTAAFLALIAAVRFTVSLFSTSKKLLLLFILLTVIISVLTYEGLLSVLGCTAALFSTVASFQKSDKLMRQLMVICSCFWITHNLQAGSPAAVIMEVLFLGSNIVGYLRYYIRPHKPIIH